MTNIKVTQQDIDLGIPTRMDTCKCVIARALRRELPWWRKWGFVSVGVTTYFSGWLPTEKQLPDNAVQLIRDVIAGRPVKPIEFEI